MPEPVSRQVDFFKQAKIGFIAMSIRSILTFLMQTASVLVLAHYLAPGSYGLFGIFIGWISALTFFTDAGIGGALVHRSDAPGERELRAFLGLRMMLSILMAVILWVLSPVILEYYQVPSAEDFRLMVLLLPLSVLSSAARVQLARKFEFQELARAEVFASVCAYGAQIGCAVAGLGVWSLAAGVASRHVADVISTYFFAAQKKHSFIFPSFAFVSLKKYLDYGILYQVNALVTSSRAIVIPLAAALYLDVNQIGLIFWIAGLTNIPMIFASSFNSSFFPVLSRLKDKPEEARAAATIGLEKVVTVFGFIFGFGASVGPLLVPILFHARWQAAIPFVPLEAAATGLATIRYLGNTVLTAKGRPGVRVVIETGSIALEVGMIALWGRSYQMHGYYYGLIVAMATSLFVTAWSCRDWLAPRLGRRFAAATTGAIAGYAAVLAVTVSSSKPGIQLLISTPVFASVFLVVASLIDSSVLKDIKRLLSKTTAVDPK